MREHKKIIVAAVAAVAALLIFAVALSLIVSIWKSPEQIKATGKAVRKEFRAAPMDEMAKRLRTLTDERSYIAKSISSFPFISITYAPIIPYDSIGLLAEEAFLKLTGDVKSPKADTDRRIKDLLDFAKYILGTGKLSDSARNSLCERRLDGYFLIGDYDGAIELLEKQGIAGRSDGWCRSTAAKLRAHKAMETKQNKEAIKQLLVFINYMLSDESKDFEDSDPANGVIYSREWVAAKNYMRCSDLAAADGDMKGKAEFAEKAKPLYKIALDKAKDDNVSLDELKKEMKSYGL